MCIDMGLYLQHCLIHHGMFCVFLKNMKQKLIPPPGWQDY